MSFRGTFGIQYAIHYPVWRDLSMPELLRLAEITAAGELEYLWLDDAFDGRQTLCTLAAMAARVPSGYGTMVKSPWGQNPLDLAGALGAIAELMPEGRDLRIGMSTGRSAGRFVDRPRPVRMVREAIELCRRLLDGEEVALREFPAMVAYFHLREDVSMQLPYAVPGRVSFWIPPAGPQMMRATADLADGVVVEIGTRHGFRALGDGTVAREFEEVEQLRRERGNPRPLRRLLQVEMSLGRNRQEALERAHLHASAAARRGPHHDAAKLGLSSGQGEPTFSESDLEAMFLVGTPDDVGERLLACMDAAEELGCEHIMLAVPAGPQPMEVAELAGQVLVPLVQGRSAELQRR